MKTKRQKKPLNISQIIALGFFAVILCGTLLLILPFSSRDGVSCGFKTALFTATSSTCVTGLIVADTYTQWSGFGQTVIISLIEIGGLGFMTVASTIIFLIRKRINMNEEMIIAQSIGSSEGNAASLQKKVIFGCLITQFIGGLILSLRFMKEFNFLTSLKLGFFHSISAFCNAGFDILGFKSPNGSLIPYQNDAVILLTLAFLIIAGGIGFLVWDEIFTKHSPKKWSVYTKLVIITSLCLLVLGTVLFLITESSNPDTLKNMPFSEKILSSFFQSATSRTAGFAAIDQGALTDSGKAVTVFLMLIGGSSGSTAGGLKTVTFAVIILFLITKLKGKDDISVFSRTIKQKDVLNALTIFGTLILLAFFGAVIICMNSSVSFIDSVYETVSALATVGLTTGITSSLQTLSQIILIIFMYFGRVGILTIGIGFLNNSKKEIKIKYANTDILIG